MSVGRAGRGLGCRISALLVVALGAMPAVGTLPLAAQEPVRGPAVASRVVAERLRISVLTFGPGDAVFERFGHNAIRVQDEATGMDLAYNWGMFSFEEPGFLRRFLSGDTRYWVEAFPTSWLLAAYAEADRETYEQVLALTPEQRAVVAEFVARNALPENKFYRYDYFRDNCSTRVRDVLDSALGGSLGGRFQVVSTPWTYRSESVRLTTPDAFAQTGIDIALGPRADRPLTAWEAMFIPMRLRDFLREVTVPAATGGTTPLVAQELVLHRARRQAEPTQRRGLALGAWGPMLGFWMLLLAPVSVAARRRTRLPATVMAALWYGVTGALGVALLGMWLGSAHVFWYNNLNLLLLSPLGLVAAVPVARAIHRGASTRVARALMVVLLAQGVLAALLAPFVAQRLAGPLLLLLPGHVGLAIAFWRHAHMDAVDVAAVDPGIANVAGSEPAAASASGSAQSAS